MKAATRISKRMFVVGVPMICWIARVAPVLVFEMM